MIRGHKSARRLFPTLYTYQVKSVLGGRGAACHTRRALLDIRASSLAEKALRCRDLVRQLVVRGVVEGSFVHRREKLPRYK
jgi:hypothetical protein